MLSGNRDVRYWYGKNGELVRVRDGAQGLEIRYEYDEAGREARRIYGNGVREEREYDKAGRVVLIREVSGGKGMYTMGKGGGATGWTRGAG